MSTWSRTVRIALASALVLVFSLGTGVSAGDSAERVTKTPAAELARGEVDRASSERIVEEVASRYESQHDLQVGKDSLQVFAVPDGDGYVVAPSLEGVLAVVDTEVATPDGVQRTATFELETAARTTEAGLAPVDSTSGPVGQDDVAAAASWEWKAGSCFTRLWEHGAWIDHCYKLYKYSSSISTGNGMRDAYAMFHYATAGPRDTSWWLTKARVWNDPHPDSSTMEWADWQPRSSDKKNCVSYPITLSVGSVSVSHSAQWCETWTPTKYVAAGKFHNEWSGAVTGSATREIAYGVEVYVPVGGWPQWHLYKDVDYVVNCC